jgi:hypothetical protein
MEVNVGLSEEERARYWDKEARRWDMKVEEHKERYHIEALYVK